MELEAAYEIHLANKPIFEISYLLFGWPSMPTAFNFI